VKGRIADATTITVTRNEILTALNKPDSFILAIAKIDDSGGNLQYVRQPFRQEPDFEVTCVIYELGKLLLKAEAPS